MEELRDARANELFRDARRTSDERGEATAADTGTGTGTGTGSELGTPTPGAAGAAGAAGGRATKVGSVHVVSPLRALPQYTRPDEASVYCCHDSDDAIAACVRQRGRSAARREVGDASTLFDD